MQQTAILVAAILGASLIFSVFVYVQGKLKIEQQKTLQKMIDQGVASGELGNAIGLGNRIGRDFRRGMHLIIIGAAWTGITFFIGGKAWILGFAPIAIGLLYLLLWKYEGSKR
ncbi:MAG: hypothetical protein ACREO1_15035 [Arenimonas sp.]